MSSQAPKDRAMAWDPKCPAALMLPEKPSGDQQQTGTAALQIHSILSHTGVGCNEHELSALIQLLDAYEVHTSRKPSERSSWNNTKALSKAYRAALRECLSRWEDHLADLEDKMEEDNINNTDSDNDEVELDVENLELLKLVYAITHLSEIFLLPAPPEASLEYYSDSFHIPGAITADTVRYLRHHHTVSAVQQVDPDFIDEISNSLHPDQINDGEPYWSLMNALVRRGNLEEAWALLSRHSLFQRAVDATDMESLDEYDAMVLQQDKEAFLDLRRIFLSAPLPGGRDESDDVGLDGPNNRDLEDRSPRKETLLEGLEQDAYQMWETSRTTSEGTDFPVTYNPRAASLARSTWHQYIIDLESVKRLRRKIPQVEPIMDILMGKLKRVPFESWAEALLAELIYGNPSILPGNIHVRAEAMMKKYPQTNGEMDQVLLEIMKGNAGTVIEVMHAFGGASGAALPATMVRMFLEFFLYCSFCGARKKLRHCFSSNSTHS